MSETLETQDVCFLDILVQLIGVSGGCAFEICFVAVSMSYLVDWMLLTTFLVIVASLLKTCCGLKPLLWLFLSVLRSVSLMIAKMQSPRRFKLAALYVIKTATEILKP